MVLIEFFDTNVINSLVPVYSIKPEYLYFVIDEAQVNESQTLYIRQAIENWNIVKSLEFVKTDKENIADICEKITAIAVKHKESEICMDFTGGFELMIACGYGLCDKYNITPLYADVNKQKLINIKDRSVWGKTDNISLGDYITAIGGKFLNNSHMEPDVDMYDNILCMAEYIFDSLDEWHALQLHLSKRYAGGGSMDATIPERLKYNEKMYEVTGLVDSFCRYGFLQRKEKNNQYRFKNIQSKQYMVTFGIWLEMYVYIKAKEYFDEAGLGVVIDWKNADGIDTQDNELDVVVLKNSIPVIISCKMCKPGPNTVYEVGFLAKRFGGRDAKAIIATSYSIVDDNGHDSRLKERFTKMGVGFIDAQEFRKHAAEEVFERAIKSIRP